MATYSSILAWRIPWTEALAGVAKSQTELKQPNRQQVRQRLKPRPCNSFLKKLSPGSQGQSQTSAVTPRTAMRICSDTENTTS